jgi:ketosteroid isomerase-like protein
MMSEHVNTVKSLYEAFGRGDIATILANVADQTEWGFNVAQSDVPWHAPVKGKAALPRFFEAFGQVQLTQFEPRAFLTNDGQVATLIHIEYTVKKTGRKVVQDQIHLWQFDASGKIASMQHFEDTAQVLSAFHG